MIKKKSFWIGITGLILAVIAFLPALIPLQHGHPLTQDSKPEDLAYKQMEIVVGFLILWLTSAVAIFLQQLEVLGDHEERKQLIGLLKFDRDAYQDKWVYDQFHKIYGIKQSTEGLKVHLRVLVEDAISDARHRCVSASSEFYQRHEESRRHRRLKQAVEHAVRYIYAVTYDSDDYTETFWSGPFYREYLRANEAAANKKVDVNRVFVVDAATISNRSSDRAKKISSLVRDHKKHSINVKVVSKSSLPLSWHTQHRSFLVCDDCVASESYFMQSNSEAEPGYVAYNDSKKVDKLKTLFQDLAFSKDDTITLLGK